MIQVSKFSARPRNTDVAEAEVEEPLRTRNVQAGRVCAIRAQRWGKISNP